MQFLNNLNKYYKFELELLKQNNLFYHDRVPLRPTDPRPWLPAHLMPIFLLALALHTCLPVPPSASLALAASNSAAHMAALAAAAVYYHSGEEEEEEGGEEDIGIGTKVRKS